MLYTIAGYYWSCGVEYDGGEVVLRIRNVEGGNKTFEIKLEDDQTISITSNNAVVSTHLDVTCPETMEQIRTYLEKEAFSIAPLPFRFLILLIMEGCLHNNPPPVEHWYANNNLLCTNNYCMMLKEDFSWNSIVRKQLEPAEFVIEG